MFYDTARIYVKAGDGGNGVVAFRREKYVPQGGPSGGDGGAGGSVVLVADPGLRTLVDFHYRKHYRAERGEHGQGKNMHGAKGADLCLRVPVGTLVREAETGRRLADLVEPGQQVEVARGGRGGRGNARFVSSNRRAPAFAEKGEPGEERWLELELKLLADVGLIGFPNTGKSTLISRISAARPKIANYPFTTTVPNLGLVRLEDGSSFVVADIPGLIEGAHAGAGLGHQFLRHTERTRVLLQVLDIAGSEGRDPLDDVEIINRELQLFNPRLAERVMVLVANKIDLPGSSVNLQRLREKYCGQYEVFPISALTGEGVWPLVRRMGELLAHSELAVPEAKEKPEQEPAARGREEEELRIDRDADGVVRIHGASLERLCAMTDFNNPAGVERFQHLMKRMGVDDALRRYGLKPGELVRIQRQEFEWVE